MKSFRGRRSVSLAALSLAGAVCGSASNARAREVDLHLEGGMIFGVNISEMSPRPTFGGDVSWWWSPTPRFQLGVATGLAMTKLPYGCGERGLLIGERGHSGCGDGLTDYFTWFPRVSFGSRLFVTPTTALGANVGTTFIWPTVSEVGYLPVPLADVTLIPLPTGGISLETKLGAADRWSLRLGIMFTFFGGGFLVPTLALGWT